MGSLFERPALVADCTRTTFESAVVRRRRCRRRRLSVVCQCLLNGNNACPTHMPNPWFVRSDVLFSAWFRTRPSHFQWAHNQLLPPTRQRNTITSVRGQRCVESLRYHMHALRHCHHGRIDAKLWLPHCGCVGPRTQFSHLRAAHHNNTHATHGVIYKRSPRAAFMTNVADGGGGGQAEAVSVPGKCSHANTLSHAHTHTRTHTFTHESWSRTVKSIRVSVVVVAAVRRRRRATTVRRIFPRSHRPCGKH